MLAFQRRRGALQQQNAAMSALARLNMNSGPHQFVVTFEEVSDTKKVAGFQKSIYLSRGQLERSYAWTDREDDELYRGGLYDFDPHVEEGEQQGELPRVRLVIKTRPSGEEGQALRKQFDLREEIGPSDYIVRMLALTHTTAVSDIAGLVMEKASMSLMSYVNSRDDGLPMSEVKQIGLDLLFGLSKLNRRSLYLSNLHPRNILIVLDAKGRVSRAMIGNLDEVARETTPHVGETPSIWPPSFLMSYAMTNREYAGSRDDERTIVDLYTKLVEETALSTKYRSQDGYWSLACALYYAMYKRFPYHEIMPAGSDGLHKGEKARSDALRKAACTSLVALAAVYSAKIGRRKPWYSPFMPVSAEKLLERTLTWSKTDRCSANELRVLLEALKNHCQVPTVSVAVQTERCALDDGHDPSSKINAAGPSKSKRNIEPVEGKENLPVKPVDSGRQASSVTASLANTPPAPAPVPAPAPAPAPASAPTPAPALGAGRLSRSKTAAAKLSGRSQS